ncbi:protein FAR1-RELATED SEQUENCE 5-like [Apium graveolens]|uniref:protein FAR1-RELATED SEQUENCE 5-like n=1 Tax=Apium graveolens TaxID=4045 RepID=UPI003D78CD48
MNDDDFCREEKMNISDDDVDDDDGDDDMSFDKKSYDFSKSNTNSVVPCVGIFFNTLDEAENFYRDYGRSVRFEIIIRSTHRHSRGNGISSRLYICRKGGRLGSSTKLDVDYERKEKRRIKDVIPRTNCSARMCVTHRVKNDKWEVTLVKLEHDHDMVTSDKGGVEKLGFSNQDVRNVIRDIRRRVFDSDDAGSGMALLRQLKEKSFGNFFYRVDLDEENRVRGLVWVDHRSLNAYTNFGDVVSFDSTYRTNRYCMPFIPITGVNHHYQNILFGFALMRDEMEISYKWVLKTWLEAVGNKPPLTIITDPDLALGNAIAEIFPDTKHILCSWHISNKFPEKLSALYTQYPEFKGDLNDYLYKSLSPTEFVGKWEVLVDKYGLEDHVWLNDMYAIKDK